LTRYNQKLVAIITTTVLTGLVLLFIGGIGALIYSFYGSTEGPESGIQVRGSNLNTDTTVYRTQQVSFHNPVLLDSARQLFIIPIGQVNLEKREKHRTSSNSVEMGFGYDSRSDMEYYSNS